MNVIAGLDFKLPYCDTVVQHISHYTMETLLTASERVEGLFY